jgi:hypothetical protein
VLGVGGVGLFCGRVHLQTRETKGNQGKPRETKEKPREPRKNQGNQGKPRKNQGKTKGNQGKAKGNQGNPLQSTKEIPSNQWEYLQSIGFLSKQG